MNASTVYSSTLKLDAVNTSETSVTFDQDYVASQPKSILSIRMKIWLVKITS
jgi:hypothetical protein